MRFLIRSLSFLLVAAVISGQAQAETKPPNILFFYADDMGMGDLHCFGSPHAQTPRLDELASEGARFTQFYVSHCVCSPTRTTAITGQYPSRHRIFSFIGLMDYNREQGMPDWLDVKAPSLPRAMQAAGYRTAVIGKWHLGGGSCRSIDGKAVNHPDAPAVEQYGFDHVRTSFGNSATWKQAKPVSEPHELYPYHDEGWLTYSSEAIADDTLSFLDDHVTNHSDKPFMANVWFKDPHTPLKPTREMRAAFPALKDPAQSHYAMVKFMDTQIGRVLDKVKELGLAENTLVIFTTDNGAAENRGGSTGGLRGWKWFLFEGGIRVPLIMRWPGIIEPGREETAPINLVDFAPTFCQLAGASMPEGYTPDGEDLTDLLKGKPWRRSKSMYWHHPTAGTRCPSLAMRKGDWKFMINPDGSWPALFDLATDPGEKNNLVEREKARVRSMKRALMAWYGTIPKP